MTNLVNRLNVAAIVMGNLPEKPGFNGSVLLIDDAEVATIAKVLEDAAAALSAPAEPKRRAENHSDGEQKCPVAASRVCHARRACEA